MGLVFICVPALLLTGCFGGGPQRLSVSDQVATAQMVGDLATARVIFIGECHDRRYHHQLQLELIKALHRQGIPLSLGFEMFDLEAQPVLDAWVRGKVPLQEFVAQYQRNWTIDWAEYDSLMLFARNNTIPMVALDAPADIVQQVSRFGADGLDPATRRRLPASVTTELSPAYRDFMARSFRTHALPDAMFDNFCAAQGVRNSVMAQRIRDYLGKHPGQVMVVIAGAGHTMRRAVPAALSGSGYSVRIVIPWEEGFAWELDDADMDYLVWQ